MASCFGCGDASVEQEDKLAVVRGLLLAGADPNTQDPGHETVRALFPTVTTTPSSTTPYTYTCTYAHTYTSPPAASDPGQHARQRAARGAAPPL